MSKKSKKVTAANKGAGAKVIAAAKEASAKIMASVKPEVPVVKEESKLTRPAMPESFCLEAADWNSNSVCFDPNSNGCKTCMKDKDFAKTVEACRARTTYLKATSGKGEKAKKAGVPRKSRDGKPTQTEIINTALIAKSSKEEIIALLAASYGKVDDVNKSIGSRRLERHLKSIKDGSCKSSEKMASCVTYLEKKVAAPKVAKS